MKYLSMAFIALGLLVSGVALADNPTESVIIHYSGTVTIPPCTITTQSIGIDFGDIEANTLAESSSATEWKDVAVLLTNCTDVTTATMTVSDTPSAANPQYIASTGTAEHVGIEAQAFYYSNIPLSNGAVFQLGINGASSYSFDIHARLHNDGTGAATLGTVVSTITLSFEFK